MATYSEKDIICTNRIIPKFIPDNLKWYERDGLDTWYLKGKCDDFLSDTDSYFQNLKVINCDMIPNKLTNSETKKYETVDFKNLESFSNQNQEEITNSLFTNINNGKYHITRDDIKKQFEYDKVRNKKLAVGRGRFLKQRKDTMYAKYW